MWLKRITPLRLARAFEQDPADIAAALERKAFVPCSALQAESAGFVEAFGQPGFARAVEGAVWMQVRIERKRVPSSALKSELAARIEATEAAEGRTVGRREKKELKERVHDELLAQVLPVQSTATLVLDPQAGHLLMDASGTRTIETLVELLREALPALVLVSPDFERPVHATMADLLLAAEDAPSILSADSTLALKEPSTGAAARFSQFNLHTPEVIAHLKSGMIVASMALTFADRISFALSNDFKISRVKFLDLVKDDLADAGAQGAEEEVDATLALQVGETRELLAGLGDWLAIKDGTGDDARDAAAGAAGTPTERAAA